ncbi:bZIP transcription factor, putative [Aspergillus udagawae]|uniref:BZIP transcription factor, putative n=1 Tax=Aspergillus udagawae TaxID=91492 RepID=A0A8E0V491_9EURO|nr:uncharacterized protein Aud_008081 [Aspergillus udagawae]GFF23361.1 bZIP transcription factor, putative [Aspergillus udagawae]GIC91634.1 hypothetical protein Aud_008081 [Aspergillus udagawae]
MSSNQDTTQPATKKRESRAGTRKVTTLSAEQLARKRANDREAQRTIRQRTKEHIERLQNQVAELQAKNQQFDDVMRRNAALEHEIKGLRQQLAMLTGNQSYSSADGSYTSPAGATPPSHYSESLNVPPVSRAPSVLSASSQISVAQEWQTYGSTRSSSICESSDADYSNRAESYGFEAQAQPPHTIPNAIPHANFNTNVAHAPDPTFQQYPQYFRASGPESSRREQLLRHPQQALPYVPSQPPMPIPDVPPDRAAGAYPVLQGSHHYLHSVNQPGINQPGRNQPGGNHGYSYGWPHQS